MDRFERKRYGWLGFLVVIACAAGIAGVLAYRTFFVQSQIDRVETALKALCAQRHDLDQRIALTNRLLRRHRGQRLIFSIPATLIVAGRDRDKNTRKNLAILDCKE